ncbi:MAG: RHS repeat-associated core domain-containing protein, partial [Prevotella histicola]|uniref:RHS repeat-associated core domain-containing protein n=1 Tax=Prevotella histicola TaxID=470565 RepID=UPI001CADD649
VPQGWIQTPHPNTTPGTNPSAPVSWNDPSNPDDPQAGYGYVPNDTTREETFFYHSDHLGSTSYITDDKANITQYDAYLPYGELLVDEHNSSEELPYKFNGKQFDDETGLYYYGARYLNPVTCLWYGVDPLAEKYKEIGSYVYCADNPINLFDPDGQKFIYNAQGKFLRKEGKDNLVYIERDGKLTQLIDHGNGMTDEQFNIAAHIVDVESSDAPNESLWIAHAANNAVDDKDVNYAHVRVKGGPRVKNHSLYEQLNNQNYSTTPASARVAYDKDYLTSSTRTTARAGIIDALQSDIDPTHGATLWDGTDFATKGLSHPKFRQYNKITIPDNIRKDYVYRNESYLQRIKSKMRVSPVFERNGIFIHDGKSTAKFSLIATGSFGRTIFWHKK